jgi:glutaredoxin
MTTNLENYTVKELNVIAKKLGLTKYSKLRKKDLISLIATQPQPLATQPLATQPVAPQAIDKCIDKKCLEKYICNPPTGRCVLKEGKIGKGLVQSFKEDEWFIFTINNCGSCKKAKELFNLLKIKYKQLEVKDSEKDIVLSELKLATSNYKYFPVIFKNKNFIGGYVELEKMLKLKPDISNIHMINPKPVSKINFNGQPWDDLISMLYIMHRHPNECVAIPLGLLTNSGKLTTKAQKVRQFIETSLEWSEKQQQFLIPIGLWESIKSCLAKGSKFIVMPIGFSCINGSAHANFLVYNSETKELERFEPYGFVKKNCLNPPNFSKKLGELFNKYVKKDMVKKVFDPLSFCPNISFQFIEEGELKEKKPSDPKGFCLAWSSWYADTRLANPNKTREEVVNMSLKELQTNPKSFTQYIRSYSGFLEKIGKEIKRGENPGKVFAKHLQKYT